MAGSDVELRTLRMFLVLADELHFVRTADRIGVTPSRVSQMLRGLEQHVGGALFVRNSRRVTLTPVGEQLRTALAPLCVGLDAALQAARDEAGRAACELRLGTYFLANIGPNLAAIRHDLAEISPHTSMRVTDIGMKRNPLEVLRAGEVDVLAMRLPLHDDDLVIGPRLTMEHRAVVVTEGHPLTAYDSVSLEDIADYRVNHTPQMPSELMDDFVPARTPSGRPVGRATHGTLIDAVAAVATGEIVHLTVRSFMHYNAHPGLVTVDVHDMPPSETALVWLADRDTRAIRDLACAAARHQPREPAGPAPTEQGVTTPRGRT